MRIDRHDPSSDRLRRLDEEIGDAATNKGLQGRVCGDSCTVKCPQCGSTGCQCECAPDCPLASQALSVDPERHPVEPAVTPLVYEMRRTGLFLPCWSCEGHNGKDGVLWKIPRVWFYCESTVHLRLLVDGLRDMKQAGRLRSAWQVAVTFSDPDNRETTFSLEPALSPDEEIKLPALQADLAEIAKSLESLMTGEARRLQGDGSKAADRDG